MAEGVTIRETPLAPALNLRGEGDAFRAAAARALGTGLPDANRFVEAAGRTVVWLGPDEWLVLGTPDDLDRIEEAIVDPEGAVAFAAADVTGNRVAIEVAGPGARDLLAAGCPLDLHPRAFAPGRCAQTLMARAGVLLLQRDEGRYELHVRRSFAGYLREWLDEAAALAPTP